ncbi:MAG TPA: site-2 protease family protein [Tepidisphaeraceae bacterium]|nr:site-2 protease family protein [Tepidisphaeraceae bacterium]
MPISGIPLFQLFGIQVYLHWTWFIVAMLEYQRTKAYGSPIWNMAEYIALFGIVLTHEFGHALACRSVGGTADRILLWPLGGVAFVSPPQRPGATLWSIAAGPLVNVILVPVTLGLAYFSGTLHEGFPFNPPVSNGQSFAQMLFLINLTLLIFNMLPIYPLDGGQILRSILWFFIGPIRSLLIASVIGLVGAGLGVLLALFLGDMWLVVMAAFAAMQSWAGFLRARAMGMMDRMNRMNRPQPDFVSTQYPVQSDSQPLSWRDPNQP